MLDKRIYEALPYLYLLLGAGLAFNLQHAFSLLFASLLFGKGAMLWILRSRFRRRRQRLTPKPAGPWPFWCYEALPFIYVGVGVLLLALGNSPWWQASAVLLLAAGGQLWGLRAIQRRVS